MSQANSITYAQNHQFFYYGTLVAYNFGASYFIEAARAAYSVISLVQLYSGTSRYGSLIDALKNDIEPKAIPARNWTNYKNIDQMKKVWWIQLARAVSCLALVFFAPLVWTLKDLVYAREKGINPYKEPFTHNFMGYDEVFEAKAWLDCTTAYINEHMQTEIITVDVVPSAPPEVPTTQQ